MLLLGILLVLSLLNAEVVPPYGSRVLSMGEGGRSYMRGTDYIRINPAATMSDEVSGFGMGTGIGLGYFSFSAAYLSEYNYSFMASFSDIDSDFDLGTSSYDFAYAYPVAHWLVAGVTAGYERADFGGGLDMGIGLSIGAGAEKKQYGFMSSLVFRNLFENHGFREVSAGLSYLFAYGFNISADHIFVEDPSGNRFDLVFSFEFCISDYHCIMASTRIYDISDEVLVAYGLGWGYNDEDYRLGFGIYGSELSRLLYGFSFTWNY
ncbi:MAG: hypothetical protein JXA66_01675 [Oligoflexia bacterium]|nr:hypothetical protein [Oligoflexia bacterium]